jgi:hypothetical protein
MRIENSTPIGVLFVFKDPAMPCAAMILNLLSQGGHLTVN